ncbi:FecR domain-containing protein [uncultured Chitinophaga sp.]|jgi:Fe2+-dicitrate sensor, membrane component|uniref:FecR family protein n=1 Tax=uncultured Chitinophaga sp. TaxID=339340 RepID=UPI00262030E3|nr:FecR domain-containing protein [uncultured Chitinophaga sp.]
MKFNEEHIYQLLLEKQLGEISKENDRYLQQVIQQDEHVRNCWFELENAKIATNNDILEDLRADLAWCKIEALLRPAPSFGTRVLTFMKRYRAAAAVAGVLITFSGFAYYNGWLQRSSQPAAGVVASATPTPAAKGRLIKAKAKTETPPGPEQLPANNNTAQQDAKTQAAPATAQTPASAPAAQDDDNNVTVEWNTLTVPPKTDYRIELADGTEVHLNASSTLRFPFIFPGKTREVYLEGEAYFIVAKNPKQPFIVHTPSTSVKALGTAFNINSYDSGMIITSLVQGAAVTDVGDTLDVTLKPGYEAIYRTGERFKVKRFDESITLGWREGIYRFRNKNLRELEPVIQRWFGLKLAFDRQSMAAMQYSGCLEKDKPLQDFLEQLSSSLNIGYRIYDNTIHFHPRT